MSDNESVGSVDLERLRSIGKRKRTKAIKWENEEEPAEEAAAEESKNEPAEPAEPKEEATEEATEDARKALIRKKRREAYQRRKAGKEEATPAPEDTPKRGRPVKTAKKTASNKGATPVKGGKRKNPPDQQTTSSNTELDALKKKIDDLTAFFNRGETQKPKEETPSVSIPAMNPNRYTSNQERRRAKAHTSVIGGDPHLLAALFS